MAAIDCPACQHPVPEESWNLPAECGFCGAQLEVVAFPAMFAPPAVASPEAIAESSEAACFYHPENRAVVPCDGCGKFLCAVCDLDLDGRHLCHECLDRGIKGNAASIEDRRVLWDSMALGLTTWPLFGVYLPIFTAPIALFLAFRHWRAPASIVPRTRIRWVIAVVLAIAEIVGIAALILWAIQVAQRAPAAGD